MHARFGERLVGEGHKVGQPDCQARLRRGRGSGGQPPVLVAWSAGGGGTLVVAGPEVSVDHGGMP